MSGEETLHYNIHDLISLSVHRYVHWGDDFFKDMRSHFRYFQTNGEERRSPESLSVYIGPFEPELKGNCVDRKYWVDEDYIYCRDRFGPFSFKVEVTGLESAHTTVRFEGNIFGSRALLGPNVFINDWILRPLLEIKLLRLGYCLSHSAAVQVGNKALLLSGRGGSRKTSLTMSLVKRGHPFFGDDFVILGPEGTVLSFPTHLDLFLHKANQRKEEEMSLWQKFKYSRRSGPPSSADYKQVAQKATVDCAFLLMPSKIQEETVQGIFPKEAAESLASNNVLEMMAGPFYQYMLAYEYVFPRKLWGGYRGKLLDTLRSHLNYSSLHLFSLPINSHGKTDQLVSTLLKAGSVP